MRYSRAGAVWCAIYLSAVFCLPSAAADEMVQESRCVKGSILLNHRLEKEYVEDDFHIFYSLQGRDALKYQYDSSGSGVPDSIKDIAGQLQAAKYLYSSVLGLRFPLQQKIYAQARQINVYVLQLPKGNGLAFDRVAAETMSDGRQLPCGLKFVLNAALEPARNITPAHEFFHLYQYGYAVFKQKWYLEGMARWMENSFKAPEKIPGGSLRFLIATVILPAVITPRITGRALRKHILLMSLSPPQHSVFVTATVRQF